MFERQFKEYFSEQKRLANPRRLEMLNRKLTGEIELLKEVIYPVLGSFHGLEMEYEMMGLTGVRIFGDFFYEPLRMIIECEGFVTHAEVITRDRFDFEKMRIRTIAQYEYRFIPFSWNEIDKKSEVCRRQLYAIIGQYSSSGAATPYQLSVYEREIIRYAIRLNRPFDLADACYCLQMGRTTSIKVLKTLLGKGLIRPVGDAKLRIHAYELEDAARSLFL
ncbi:hypothetical protein [Cohnella luojiensis]|uniref:Uncharacterized protein n=1 Tax=Cohnella luojiensis TaxID=652876 RepID=A0A4Y8M2A7_9BACL|nr:hypothetical protein [Cohnella luojiensis]TFE29079.1 hypothetical protein E2980_06750 [Cohnella luojiensis]